MGYTRIFMPFENESGGFEFRGRAPAGRAIVESRNGQGKLICSMQDIKQQERYGVYLLFADGAKFAGVHIASAVADERGKAEARKEFPLSALGGFNLDELAAVAVIASLEPPIAPLCGYRERPFSWRSKFVVAGEKTPSKPEKTVLFVEKQEESPPEPEVIPTASEAEPEVIPVAAEEEPEVVPTAVEAEPEVIPVAVEAEPEAIPVAVEAEPEVIPVVAKEKSPSKPEVIPVVKREETVAIPVAKQEDAPRVRKPRTVKPRKQKNPVRTENIMTMESIFRSKPHVKPFENFDRETKWVALSINDAVPLPHNRPLLLEEPFVRAAYANHDHLLLGLTDGGAEYILGVPCKYKPEERPQAKRLGFTKFKNNISASPKRGDDGYWLMFVDM